MSKKQNDPGIQTVGKIYRDLQIDTEWGQIFNRGFVWWGHHYAQTIWADEPVEEDGLHISKVHGEIDFLRYSEKSAFDEDTLAHGMTLASMSGPILYPKTKTITLHCSAFVHEENQFWLAPLFQLALMVQNFDAESKAEQMAEILEWKPAQSNHPTSGPRPQMDDMLNLVEAAVIPEGRKPSERLSPEMFHNMASDLKRSGLVTTSDDEGLTAYVPFGSEAALFRANIAEDHPALGKGLLLTLALPPEVISETYDINGALILELNRLEKETSEMGHFLGSWCLGKGRGAHETTPAFVTFIPAFGCNANVFTNMIFSNLNHCRWVGETLFE
jgi:hypothetical protein